MKDNWDLCHAYTNSLYHDVVDSNNNNQIMFIILCECVELAFIIFLSDSIFSSKTKCHTTIIIFYRTRLA